MQPFFGGYDVVQRRKASLLFGLILGLILGMAKACREPQRSYLRQSSGRTESSDGSIANDKGEGEDKSGDRVKLSLYAEHCSACHGELAVSDKRGVSVKLIKNAIERVEKMAHLKALSDADIEAIAAALSDDTLVCRAPQDPGPQAMRRLNRGEYNNTVKDLLGLGYDVSELLPVDQRGKTFSNIASVQTLTDNQMELYLKVAEKLVGDFLASKGATRQKFGSCDPTPADARVTCLTSTLQAFASAAFRRNVTTSELAPYLERIKTLSDGGLAPNDVLATLMQAILVSPQFLFMVEQTGASTPAAGLGQPLSDYELASRLSYFLWGTMPDSTLLELAGKQKLKASLREQASRMIADPRSEYAVRTFAREWLQLYRLKEKAPAKTLFPSFDTALLAEMEEETLKFFSSFKREGGSLLNMYDAPFTFATARLAAHYGLSGQSAAGNASFQKIELSQESLRRGLLAQGAVLAATSGNGTTSPVRRGNWIAKQILCTTMPDPPAGVTPLPENGGGVTLKDRLERHRNDPACASCHELMDPAGFALEGYNAVGQHRTKYEDELPVDNEGVLSNGVRVRGAQELGTQIKASTGAASCIVRQLTSFAVGSEQQAADSCAINDITDEAKGAGFSFEGILMAIIMSPKFTQRTCAGEGASSP